VSDKLRAMPKHAPGTKGSVETALAEFHELPVRVYYEDTDSGGVVYYANYLRFLERARTEMLRVSGLDQSVILRDAGLAFVVRHAVVDYRASARLDDQLLVRSRVLELRHASVTFDQDVLREGKVLVSAQIKVACVDMQRGKAAAFPRDVAKVLEPGMIPHLKSLT
jgi:acyl-CoA thioester hydrolase